jgi:exopolysaccharide production protein ExoQ
MPPQIAALVYILGVVWLFRRDFRERPNVTAALWLPFFWIFISGSRFFTQWLEIFGLDLGGVSVEEGSPVDAFVFFGIIISGVYVLHRRRVNWSEFMRNNRWVTIYLCYCLLAITWSDFPFVAFKRWIKLFGQPIMVLVLLTEPDPVESFTRLLKRFAYMIVPISILFIKYFPQFGSCYDTWTGQRMNTGITTDKNALGCDCFILTLFFIWHFLRVRHQERGVVRRHELLLCFGFLVALGWLLNTAHSSTPIGALILALAVMWFLGLKFVERRRLGTYLVVFVVVCALGEFFFGIHNLAIHALGRNSTLTGRTEIWQILLHWNINPILGVGFESFWLGDRIDKLAELLPGLPLNEAHNGYLETYIQLGLLGVFITIAMLAATYFKAHRALLNDFDFGRFRLAYLAGFIVYNWTEAAFRTHAFPFFMFFLIAIDYQTRPLLEKSSDAIIEPEPSETAAGVH